MTRVRTFLILGASLSLMAGVARADFRKEDSPRVIPGVALNPAPELPTPQETTVAKVHNRPHQHIPGMTRSENLIGTQMKSFLLANPSSAGVASMPSLRVDYVHLVPGAQGVPDTAYARFVQTHKGLDVEGSQVVVSLRLDSTGGHIDVVNATLFPSIQTRANAGSMRALDGESHVRSRLGAKGSNANLKPLGERVRWLHGQWRIVHEFHVEDLGVHAAVDEATGQTDLWDARYYQTYSGKASGRVVLFNPQATTTLNTAPLKELKVTDGAAATTFSDLNGDFLLTTPSNVNISVPLAGKWGVVKDLNGLPLSATIPAGAPSPVNLLFNPSGNLDLNTAQTNGYYHENFIHNWIVSKGVDVPGIDVPFTVNVNMAATCNAYYDGVSINFYQAGGGCINTAYDTVVYHEYGHFIDDAIGGITNGALSEGWGDIVATYASGQSLVGEGFYAGQPTSFIRNVANTYHYSAFDEVHTQGQAWMGFAWDLRQSLIATLGQGAGAALAENLVLPVFYSNSPDIPSAVVAVALRDSPDGQVGDGPHFAQIQSAANNHGLGFALDVTPPSAPTALVVSAATQQSLTLSWAPATDNVGIAGYRLDVSASSDFSSLLPQYNNADVGNVTQFMISGLNPVTTYYMRLRAYDQAHNASGNSATAVGATLVPDNTPPTIAITSPANGSTLSGVVTISGTASDNVAVANVTILADNVVLGIATGTLSWSYSLDTSLLINSTHTLTARATDTSGNTNSPTINVTVFNPGQATYSSTYSAPLCSAEGAVCDSGGLLNSRANVGGTPEVHQPNTLFNSCADGTSGTYHSDESNDRLKVSSVDGNVLTTGKTAKIDAAVWAFSTFASDALDLYYTANASAPTWTYLTTLIPTKVGAQVMSFTYTLPAGNLQAVRAQFRFQGSATPCSTGGFDDHDDLAFAVHASTGVPPSLPDLTITSFAISPSTVGPNSNFAMNLTVLNQGTGPNPFNVNLQVVQDLVPAASWGANTPSLDGGQSWDHSFFGNTPSAGLHAYHAFVVSAGSETNTANNDRLAYLAVTTTTFAEAYLSDLPWLTTSSSSPVTRDKTATGHALQLNGTSYPKGLGTIANTDIVYQVPSGMQCSFISEVGIDDEMGAQGAAQFWVYGDNTGLFYSGPMKGGDPHQSIAVDVSGYSKLLLRSTDTVANSHDEADWAGARLHCNIVPDKAGPIISSITVVNLTPTTAQVNWVTNELSNSEVDFGPTSAYGFAVYDYNARLNHTLLLSGLTPGGLYHFRVRSQDAFNNVGFSTDATFIASPPPPPSSATFITTDVTTQGNWKGTYGTDGQAINSDSTNYPSYAQVTMAGTFDYVWASNTSEVRALQQATGASRIASCWATATSYSIDVNLSDGQTHQVALYGLDWDQYNGPRNANIEVRDATSNALLDSRSLSQFQNGKYLVWNLKGHVKFIVYNIQAGSNATLSGIFFGGSGGVSTSSATFITTDATTQGNWKGNYGTDGQAINSDSTNYPSYAQVSITGTANYVWASNISDVRALQQAVGGSRIASCWYEPSNVLGATYTIDVNLTDSQTHQVALYGLDWDQYNGPRNATIEVRDAASNALLDSRSLSQFQNGKYLVWNLKGHVRFTVINNQPGSNAPIAGIFFGGASATPAAAAFLTTDATTQGNWKGTYGADGQAINSDSTNYPSYAQVTMAGTFDYVWAGNTSEVRALQQATGGSRIASCWYSFTTYTIDVNLTDGQTHKTALYGLDWDQYNGPRDATIEVRDAQSNTLLDSRQLTQFQNGKYLVWNLKGHVRFTVINNQPGSNATISGIFFGGSPTSTSSATFITTDVTTQGNWKGTYGADGQAINSDSTNYPSYAQVTLAGTADYVWSGSTSDVRALQQAAGSSRIASCWYSFTTYTIDVNLTDGQMHKTALYGLDWDQYNGPRNANIEVRDATSNALLDSRSLSQFQNGKYLVWNLKGHVKFIVYNIQAGSNATLSGIFFGGNAVSSTSTTAEIPAPELIAPPIVSPSDTLIARMPANYDVQNFIWIMRLSDGRTASSQANVPIRQNTLPAPRGNKGSTTVSQMPLSGLSPGIYTVSVQAEMSTGVLSPAKQAPIEIADASSPISVLVYPNPWRAARDSAIPITFKSLTPGSIVKIFTVSGQWIRTIDGTSGIATWYPQNDSGENVASGLYIFLITDAQGHKTRGKLAIIR